MFIPSPNQGNLRLQPINARIGKIANSACFNYIHGHLDRFILSSTTPNVTFRARDLVGGRNTWNGTPLMDIHNFYIQQGVNDPDNKAAIDVGRLLKSVISHHPRQFTTTAGSGSRFLPRTYQIV